MQIRPATPADAEQAADVARRSIEELCDLDHQQDAATLAAWAGNTTAPNMRQWIATHTILVAHVGERITGVAALRDDGAVLLNYVASEARFSGASKSLMQAMEAIAALRGLQWLTLDSTATALRFYQSLGWISNGPPQPGFGETMTHPMRKAVTVDPTP